MILTKDNLLKYIREKKYVLPTTISNEFETTTMIASAALSELVKDKSIAVTHLKSPSSPYYYDLKQQESLVELGEKHLSGNDLSIFQKLKEQQIISHNALTIPEQVAISKIQDFAKPLEFEHEEKQYFFWVWYLRDLQETKKQIIDYFSSTGEQPQKQETPEKKSTPKKETVSQEKKQSFTQTFEVDKNECEKTIEQYFANNRLSIETKQKSEKGLLYLVKLQLQSFTIYFDCLYYHKKPQEAEIIAFYASSIKPKIVFVKQPPKKLIKLSESLENLTVVEL